jgi:hypothetical protein
MKSNAEYKNENDYDGGKYGYDGYGGLSTGGTATNASSTAKNLQSAIGHYVAEQHKRSTKISTTV